jgi:hypothetical protein
MTTINAQNKSILKISLLALILIQISFAGNDTCYCKLVHQDSIKNSGAMVNSRENQVSNVQEVSICIPEKLNTIDVKSGTKEENPVSIETKIDDKGFIERYQAIFTALFALIGIIITVYFASIREKANIIRKARIEWIQSLRQSFSEFIVVVEQIFIEMQIAYKNHRSEPDKEIDQKSIQDILLKNFDKIAKAEGLANNILLHLNPKEKINQELIRLIAEIRGGLSHESLVDNKFNTDAISDSMHEAAKILKKAWRQAKK